MYKLTFFKKDYNAKDSGQEVDLCAQLTSSVSYVRDVFRPRQLSPSAAEMSVQVTAKLSAVCLFLTYPNDRLIKNKQISTNVSIYFNSVPKEDYQS